MGKTPPDPRLQAAIELLEAYGATSVQPTNLDNALAQTNGFLADERRRVNRGGGCLLCYFETWFYEPLTGQEAAIRFVKEHGQQQPACPGQFVAYGGDPTEEEWEETDLEHDDG